MTYGGSDNVLVLSIAYNIGTGTKLPALYIGDFFKLLYSCTFLLEKMISEKCLTESHLKITVIMKCNCSEHHIYNGGVYVLKYNWLLG